jgi:5-(carboxyamino)imidazole ribonucleotide mutase
VAVGTLAIGAAGAWNAGLLASQMLAADNPELLQKIADWKASRADEVLANAELGQG